MIWRDRPITAQEEQAIAAFMGRVARLSDGVEPRFANPDILLVKAQLLRRWDAERKVQAPLDLMEPIQIVAGLAAAVLLVMWSLPSLFQWLPAITI